MEMWKRDAHWFAPPGSFPKTCQDYWSLGGTVHSKLGPPTSVNNQNPLQTRLDHSDLGKFSGPQLRHPFRLSLGVSS